MALDFQLTFAGVPFVSDSARVVRTHLDSPEYVDNQQAAPRKHQPLTDLQDEINRLIPFHYLKDFSPADRHAGRNLSAISRNISTYPQPNTEVRIGDWYYPNGASRWSVFRGLATSSQVGEMLAQTGGSSPATFVMQMNPLAPNHPDSASGPYTLVSSMYMLPPRPLAEYGGGFDGLYLVTLVDERYYFKYYPVSLHPIPGTTWTSLLSTLASILNIPLTIPSISSVYGTPEPDSQLWSNFESAATLLDAVALNVGTKVVRDLDGTYSLLSSLDSQAIVNANRGNAETVVRAAGGDIFYQGGFLPVGDLTPSKNSVVPSTIYVNFPKYITGNDPVPHYLNSRFANQRPTSWYEDSFGEVHSIGVPIQSGGPLVAGLLGTGVLSLQSTAKALYSTEATAASGMAPLNSPALTSLAMQLSQNLYNSKVAFALDEVYPGTYAWQPEGLHDIIWTYSQSKRLATTRVMKIEWNRQADEFQHSHVPLAGSTNVPPGEGGQSVAQTWRDGSNYNAGEITVETANTMGASDTVVSLNSSDCLPTQNRWKGQIDSEIILFEGTSGGTSVNIVYRGIDGTIASPHANNAIITLLTPNQTYGVNLVTSEKMQFVYPSDWTSGGIKGVNVVPQTQTIKVFSSESESLNGVNYFSGQVQSYDTTGNLGQFIGEELVWAVERNAAGAISGSRYGGQFAGFSKTIKGVTRPVYLFTAANSFNSGTVNYNNTTINYNSGTTWNVVNDLTTNIYQNTVWNISGPGYLQINAPVEIINYQFWYSFDYTFSDPTVNNWVLPAPATIYDLVAKPGGTTITGIDPRVFGKPLNTGPITNATNTSPIVITVPGWTSIPEVGKSVTITGVNGNPGANGTWTVQAADPTSVTLQNSIGTGLFLPSPLSVVQKAGPQLIVCKNRGTDPITIDDAATGGTSSDPANRIKLPTVYKPSVTLQPDDSIELSYDEIEAIWTVIACTVEEPLIVSKNSIVVSSGLSKLNLVDSATVTWAVSGYIVSGTVDVVAASVSTGTNVSYLDNTTIVSGVKLVRFDNSGFNISGYTASGAVDVFAKVLGVWGESNDTSRVGAYPVISFNDSPSITFAVSGNVNSGKIEVSAVNQLVSGSLIGTLNVSYLDNTTLVSGVKLIRFDNSGFYLSGYISSGAVDVFARAQGGSSVPVTSSWGFNFLSAPFIVSNNTAWFNTGLSVTLPTPGTYYLNAQVTGYMLQVSGNTGGILFSELYDSSGNAELVQNWLVMITASGNSNIYNTAPLHTVYATSTSGVGINLRASVLLTSCRGNINGANSAPYPTTLSYLRIA